MKKVYIATSLTQAKKAKDLAGYFVKAGLGITFPWWDENLLMTTTDSTVEGHAARAEIAKKELDGVAKSDVLVLLLPGGRGTHVELGAALAFNKPVLIFANSHDDFLNSGYFSSFYSHPNVSRFVDDLGWSPEDVSNCVFASLL